MNAIETLRAFLVAGAAIAAVVAAFQGVWVATFILTLAVLVHGFLTYYLRRNRTATHQPTRFQG
jgi:hypothetical protein